MSEITFADIEAAAERLKGHAQRTPIATSRQLNARVGGESEPF